jgi:hypothetical protein
MEKGIDDCDNAIEDLYSVKAAKADIVNVQTNNVEKICGAALAYSMGQSLQTLNDNLALVKSVASIYGTVTGGYIKSGRLVIVSIRIVLTSDVGALYLLFSGLPHALVNVSGLEGRNETNGTAYNMHVTNDGFISTLSALTSEQIYTITGAYITTL